MNTKKNKQADTGSAAEDEAQGYESELRRLHGELVAMQEWVKATGAKVCVVFEGRDSAGKGGTIKAITERVSPRVFRVVALPTPTEREKSQMYVQRYIPHLPAAGEVVIFDRSWYNRAGVERVMGFCTDEQAKRFLQLVPGVERAMVDSGIMLLKYWLEVGRDEQTRRLQSRIDDPRKIWKLSDMDLKSYSRWYDYARARDDMFATTDTAGRRGTSPTPTTSGADGSTSSPISSARSPTNRSTARRSRCRNASAPVATPSRSSCCTTFQPRSERPSSREFRRRQTTTLRRSFRREPAARLVGGEELEDEAGEPRPASRSAGHATTPVDGQLAGRKGLVHGDGVIEAHEPVVGRDNERRHVDLLQIVRRQPRFARHHRQRLVHDVGEVVGSVRRSLAVAGGDLGHRRGRRGTRRRVEALVVVVGSDRDDLGNQLGLPRGDEQRNDGAVAPADQMGAITDDPLQDSDRLGDHVVVVERVRRIGRAAVSAAVERHDPVPPDDGGADRIQQDIAVRQAAMQEHDRLQPGATLLHPRRMPADVDVGPRPRAR